MHCSCTHTTDGVYCQLQCTVRTVHCSCTHTHTDRDHYQLQCTAKTVHCNLSLLSYLLLTCNVLVSSFVSHFVWSMLATCGAILPTILNKKKFNCHRQTVPASVLQLLCSVTSTNQVCNVTNSFSKTETEAQLLMSFVLQTQHVTPTHIIRHWQCNNTSTKQANNNITNKYTLHFQAVKSRLKHGTYPWESGRGMLYRGRAFDDQSCELPNICITHIHTAEIQQHWISISISKTRKPSCRWQTHVTRKHAKNCSNLMCLQRCHW